ncbi:MAG: sporulation protein, partial [Erysipelotrichaceae bacterium]
MQQVLLLIFACCFDSFLCSFAYGSNKVKIPLRSAFMVAIVGTLILGSSLLLSLSIMSFLSKTVIRYLSFILLFVLGISSLFKSSIQSYLIQHRRHKIAIHFHSIVIDIYLDELKADQDNSKQISFKEAFYLALALSFDSLLGGLAINISNLNFVMVLLSSFIVGLLSIYGGYQLGKNLVKQKQ